MQKSVLRMATLCARPMLAQLRGLALASHVSLPIRGQRLLAPMGRRLCYRPRRGGRRRSRWGGRSVYSWLWFQGQAYAHRRERSAPPRPQKAKAKMTVRLLTWQFRCQGVAGGAAGGVVAGWRFAYTPMTAMTAAIARMMIINRTRRSSTELASCSALARPAWEPASNTPGNFTLRQYQIKISSRRRRIAGSEHPTYAEDRAGSAYVTFGLRAPAKFRSTRQVVYFFLVHFVTP